MFLPCALLFLAVFLRVAFSQIHAHQISHHADSSGSILNMHDGMRVRGRDFYGRVRAARRGSADEQRNGETFALHFFCDVYHLFERRGDEPAQADQIGVYLAGGL